MITGQKHLVKCRCVLPQFKKLANPPVHQFIVFSILNDDIVKPKCAQCTNCGIIHNVNEISKSSIIQGREAMSSMLTADDIKLSLPVNLVGILEANNVDLPTLEAIQFIHENKQWGNIVVLTSDVEGDLKFGKYIQLLGENMFKIETYMRKEVINE